MRPRFCQYRLGEIELGQTRSAGQCPYKHQLPTCVYRMHTGPHCASGEHPSSPNSWRPGGIYLEWVRLEEFAHLHQILVMFRRPVVPPPPPPPPPPPLQQREVELPAKRALIETACHAGFARAGGVFVAGVSLCYHNVCVSRPAKQERAAIREVSQVHPAAARQDLVVPPRARLLVFFDAG